MQLLAYILSICEANTAINPVRIFLHPLYLSHLAAAFAGAESAGETFLDEVA